MGGAAGREEGVVRLLGEGLILASVRSLKNLPLDIEGPQAGSEQGSEEASVGWESESESGASEGWESEERSTRVSRWTATDGESVYLMNGEKVVGIVYGTLRGGRVSRVAARKRARRRVRGGTVKRSVGRKRVGRVRTRMTRAASKRVSRLTSTVVRGVSVPSER